jgi:hypothetical protein
MQTLAAAIAKLNDGVRAGRRQTAFIIGGRA